MLLKNARESAGDDNKGTAVDMGELQSKLDEMRRKFSCSLTEFEQRVRQKVTEELASLKQAYIDDHIL